MRFRQLTDGADLTWRDLHKVIPQVNAKAGCKIPARVLLPRTRHLPSTQTAPLCLRFPHSHVVCEILVLHTSAFMPHSGSGWAALSTNEDMKSAMAAR